MSDSWLVLNNQNKPKVELRHISKHCYWKWRVGLPEHFDWVALSWPGAYFTCWWACWWVALSYGWSVWRFIFSGRERRFWKGLKRIWRRWPFWRILQSELAVDGSTCKATRRWPTELVLISSQIIVVVVWLLCGLSLLHFALTHPQGSAQQTSRRRDSYISLTQFQKWNLLVGPWLLVYQMIIFSCEYIDNIMINTV